MTMMKRRNKKTIDMDFGKFCAATEKEKPRESAVKQFRHRAYENTNRCVACGEEIPEGRQVCPNCMEG